MDQGLGQDIPWFSYIADIKVTQDHGYFVFVCNGLDVLDKIFNTGTLGTIDIDDFHMVSFKFGDLVVWFCNISDMNWIGLDLFNDDTRPSGHISRPTQVNVSQNCFHSLNNYSSPIILSSLGAS